MGEAFPDGRFWLELGPNPPLPQLQGSLAAALGDRTPVTDVPQGRALLSRLLGERRCLLVLDNVQDQAHLPAFNVMGPAGRVLATARDTGALPGATVVPLGELAPPAPMQLLAGWAGPAPGDLPTEAAQVARECGYLPLALAPVRGDDLRHPQQPHLGAAARPAPRSGSGRTPQPADRLPAPEPGGRTGRQREHARPGDP